MFKRNYIPKVVIGLSILSVMVYIIVTVFVNKDKPSENADIPSVNIPTPLIVKEYSSNFPVNFIVDENSVNIPQKAMVYEIDSKPMPEDRVDNIVQKLGLNKFDFRSVEDKVLGKTYSYASNNKTLRIVPSMYIIDYKIQSPVLIKEIDKNKEQEYIKTAEKIAGEYGLFEKPEDLYFNKISFFYLDQMGHTSDIKKPNVARVTFNKRIDGINILSPSHETGSLSVLFNSEGNVIFIYVDDVPNLIPFKEYGLKNYDQVKKEAQYLTSLKSLKNGVISPMELSFDSVTEANIDRIDLVYAQEFNLKQRYLQPVFVLSGSVKTKDFGEVSAEFVMPAVSSL